MGTPLFAAYSLQSLNDSGFKPILVITQPDSAQGRNLRLTPPPVKVRALEMGIDVLQPEDINAEAVLNILTHLSPDIIVTTAYGGYIGKQIRLLPKFGCINLHPSMLPKYRGSSPIRTALLNGDSITGNTIYRLTSKIDAGPIYLQETIQITAEHNLSLLEHDLAVQGANLLVKALRQIANNSICEQPQDNDLATYTKKLASEDQKIDWNYTAKEIYHQIQSLSFEPGAITSFRGKPIKILAAKVSEITSNASPGIVRSIEKHQGILVSTKDYDLLITCVQPTGKKIMDAYTFHIGARIEKGEQIGF